MNEIIKTMRPRQWTKNLFLFAGLVFSLQAFNPILLFKVILAFIIFCGLSGSIYILNDLVDVEKDRQHPEKAQRPIASGNLSVLLAKTAFVIIFITAFFFAFLLDFKFFLICILYFILNLGYSFYLKKIVIIDVMIIAAGFVFRAIAGAVVIDVEISPWLLICTFFLALFLAFCKRRNELVTVEQKKGNSREVLTRYTPEVLDQMISVVTASSLMAYSFYTISDTVQQKFHTGYLFLTIPFVLFGIFRYLYLVHRENLGGSPEIILLKDIPMNIDVILWIITIFIILYFR